MRETRTEDGKRQEAETSKRKVEGSSLEGARGKGSRPLSEKEREIHRPDRRKAGPAESPVFDLLPPAY